MIKKTSIYDDMKELHKMVAPLRAGVVRARVKRMGDAAQECIHASTELALSVNNAIVAITHLVSAFKEKDIKC